MFCAFKLCHAWTHVALEVLACSGKMHDPLCHGDVCSLSDSQQAVFIVSFSQPCDFVKPKVVIAFVKVSIYLATGAEVVRTTFDRVAGWTVMPVHSDASFFAARICSTCSALHVNASGPK